LKEEDGEYYLNTIQYEVHYNQSSEQIVPEVNLLLNFFPCVFLMIFLFVVERVQSDGTLRIVLNQLGRDFSFLREDVIVSDKCTAFQSYEQILFVKIGIEDGWYTREHVEPLLLRISAWHHTESKAGKDTLDVHLSYLKMAHRKPSGKGYFITAIQFMRGTCLMHPQHTLLRIQRLYLLIQENVPRSENLMFRN
jgi:hypothetical protein